MAQDVRLTNINKQIKAVAKSETSFKALLGQLSRDLLNYVPDSNDIGAVNRLVAVLTPFNRARAIAFFKAHLEWSVDADTGIFGDKVKGEKTRKRITAVRMDLLADDNGTIWTWAEVEMPKKEKVAEDYIKAIGQAVKNGVNEEKGALTPVQILEGVLRGGVSIGELMSAGRKAKDAADKSHLKEVVIEEAA